MDKRLLIYFFILIASFFLIHEWFTPASKTVPQTSKVNIQIDPALHPEANITILEEKLYNLVQLYSDVERTKFVTYAIRQGLSYFTISWKKDLPKYLFTRVDPGPYGNISRVELFIESHGVSMPVLYGTYPNEMLKIPHVPELGQYDIRLVVLSDDNKTVNVVFGQVENEHVTKLSSMPTSPAIALFEFQNDYYPYGVYDPKTQAITKFVDIPEFGIRANLIYPGSVKPTDLAKQNYYVLQNKYQQLVFSKLNGALAEINLPFVSENNPNSVVREINFDRTLKKDYPLNDTFPQYPYYYWNDQESKQDLAQPVLGGYYPLLRRNLMGVGGKPSLTIPVHTYGFSLITSENVPEVFEFQVKRFEKNLIEFELVQQNRRIIKTFSLPENQDEAPYCFDVAIRIEGDARGLSVAPGIPEVELISDSFTPTLKYQVIRNQKQVVEKVSPPKKIVNFSHLYPSWVCNGNGFFGVIINPLTPTAPGLEIHPLSGEIIPSRLTLIDAEYNRFPRDKFPAYQMHIPLSTNPLLTKYRVYAGPFDKTILNRVDATYTDSKTGVGPNFIACISFQGWFSFISEPFAKFLFFLMNFFHIVTGSWGISIILLTIALRIMLYPLNQWSIKSTLKMQLVAPKVTAIQEKYKKDPKQAQVQIMNLYRQEGVNPFSGCLPILIQMPFLIGMFDLLKSTFELRGVPFIPGWINNLTAPDVVFSWSYPIIFFGNSFHLLPILLGVVMYFQQRYTAKAPVGGKMTDQQKQQRTMGNIMVIVFTVMFYHFPSGLNLYWLFSMGLGIVQQWWTNRQLQNKKIEVLK